MIIAAGKFKAECLKLLDQVNETHEEIIVSKRGKPVARIVPVTDSPAVDLFGFMAGTVVRERDIISPTGEVWDAQQ